MSRWRTTSSAASFSETKRTFFPLDKAAAITFVIVCDLPVPGGPFTTMFLPDRMSMMALCCDESASKISGCDASGCSSMR